MFPQQMLPVRANAETFRETTVFPQQCFLVCGGAGEQQCFRNNVSSFAGALKGRKRGNICCGNIVVSLNASPFARTGNICCGNIFCFRETKNVFDFFQKHFFFSTNVSPFARRGNNVSATVFPQQCFLVCGGLKTLRPDYSPPCMF